MANITLAGTLRDPNGDLAVGDTLRFTHKSSTGETVQTAVSFLTIPPDGQYSVDIEYGLVRIDYKDVTAETYTNLGVVTVNQDNPATSIPELLRATVPATNQEMLEFQTILANCVTAENNAAQSAIDAANSASSVNIINDLSQAYIFDTVADMQASTIVFPIGKIVKTKGAITAGDGLGSVYFVSSSSSTSRDLPIVGGLFAVFSHQNIQSVNLVVNSKNEIANLNRPDVNSISTAREGGSYSVETSIYGLESTPDTIKMNSSDFAQRVGGFKLKRDGVFSTGAFGHRAGAFTYRKLSNNNAELLTDLDKFKANTDPAFGAVVRYIDWENGLTTNDGLSWATAYSRWFEAFQDNPDIVFIKAGLYAGNERLRSFSVVKDISVIAVGGDVITGALQGGQWSKEPSKNNVYKRTIDQSGLTISNCYDTVDTDVWGAPTNLILRASIQLVDDNPGSYFVESVSKDIYVNTPTSRAITGDDNTVITALDGSEVAITYTGDFKVYMSGVKFWSSIRTGGGNTVTVQTDGTEHFKSIFFNEKCGFNGCATIQPSSTGNGLGVRGVGLCISKESECLNNIRDGFNYHIDSYVGGGTSMSPHFIEVDCFVAGNGWTGLGYGNNQGSTSHENGNGIRINTISQGHSDGGGIVDVDSVKVWNICCTSRGNNNNGMLLYADGAYDGDDGEWWIDGAVIDNIQLAPGVRSGDLAVDGAFAILHMQDVKAENPVSASLNIKLIDEVL